jgi:large subunit ribosomal protein L17
MRQALLRSLARSLILYERIETTEAKAKELRPFIERLITASKKETLATRRLIIARLGGGVKETQKLYNSITPKFSERSGGYTRITKMKHDKGGAPKAVIEFVK